MTSPTATLQTDSAAEQNADAPLVPKVGVDWLLHRS